MAPSAPSRSWPGRTQAADEAEQPGFRDREQAAEVIRALLENAGYPELWTSRGPRFDFESFMKRDGGLPDEARILVQLAYALWEPEHATVNVWDWIHELDEENLGIVVLLLLALKTGPSAIEEWLAEHGAPSSGTSELI